MGNEIVSALSDSEIVHSNALATVTRDCVVIPNPNGHAQTIVAISRLLSVKRVKSSYPGLMVIAGGLAVIAAAAACSKDGHGAALPIALLGLGFAVGYIGSRRGSVALVISADRLETIETASGSLKDATALAIAIEQVRGCEQSEAA